MDLITKILFAFGTFVFLPCCTPYRIHDYCVTKLYEEYVCKRYNCDTPVDSQAFEAEFNKIFNKNDRICESTEILNEIEVEKSPKQFPTRFGTFGTNATSFFDTIDQILLEKGGQYCYNKAKDGRTNVMNEEILMNQSAAANETSESPQICSTKLYTPNPYIRSFQQTSTFVSPIFIFLPIVIFVMTHEIQNVHGWTHFTNGCCVFALYISWGLRYLYFRDKLMKSAPHVCTGFAVTQHYLHLSVFSWLVVACHDLQKLAESHPSGKSLDNKKQIVVYSKLAIFGWGMPLGYMAFMKLIGSIFIFAGMEGKSHFASFILAEYGEYRCFLAFNAYWIHLLLPTFGLFVAANVYNWKTLRIIVQNKNDLSAEHAVQKVNVIRNMACLRAMMLTSVCWGCDVLRTFITAYDRSAVLWLRVILDGVILYQTIPIFLIYSCRPHILNHLEIKYPSLTCAIEASRTYFGVKRKEVDPDVVTQLRVHRKSDGDLVELQQRSQHS